MKTKVLFFFLSTLFLFTACDNSPEILPELKSTNQLISFKFEKIKMLITSNQTLKELSKMKK